MQLRATRLTCIAHAARRAVAPAFTPTLLFASGEQGAWYDPSDMSTLFQDSAGTTPVTAVEQPVGRMLDKSGRGNHATQATAINRPVLSARVNLLLNTETLATQSVTVAATSQTLRFEGTGSVTLSGTATGTYSAGTHTFSTTAGSLTLTVSGSVTRADLRASNDGVGLPPYQYVNTPTDYDASPEWPRYLRADGVDDGMVTSSIDFTSTDKMTVVAGVRKLSDAAEAMFAELSTNVDGNNGAFNLFAPGGISAARDSAYVFASKGTVKAFSGPSAALYAAPVSNVVTGQGNISGDTTSARVNGTQASSSTADQGTGNFGNYPLYLFRRGGSSLPFNGRFYGMTIVNKLLSPTDLALLEEYTNGKTQALDWRDLSSSASFRWNSATASPDAE
jgi:hypothetical protein